MRGTPEVADQLERRLGALRLSVTDRCNLRCQYCMPEEEYTWLSRADLLSFEELTRLTRVFVGLGVDKVRLTGGEPLLRRGVHQLVQMLASTAGISDIALTTNGVLLAEAAARLRDAGLHRVTVSIDTLDPERFQQLSRRRTHDAVLAGVAAAHEVFGGMKLDTVVLRGFNDDELVPLIEYGRGVNAEVRFIEYMDVAGATGWSGEQVVSRAEILDQLGRHYGRVTPLTKNDVAPADRFQLPDGTVFGIISSTTQPFCATCDRSRVTADGMWYRCLYAQSGTDLRTPLRDGGTDDQLARLIAGTWRQRDDQGAVDRLKSDARSVFIGAETLKTNPHLEMHTRGG